MTENFLVLSASAIVEGILAENTKRYPSPSAWGSTAVALISTNGAPQIQSLLSDEGTDPSIIFLFHVAAL